jgi:hypothetical protein
MEVNVSHFRRWILLILDPKRLGIVEIIIRKKEKYKLFVCVFPEAAFRRLLFHKKYKKYKMYPAVTSKLC